MTKFLKLNKNKCFQFSEDQSMEFKEFFDYVFERKNTLFFVYCDNFTVKQKENIEKNVLNYYVDQKGWNKVIFLKQL
jgi:hypothetical protein